MRKVIVNLVAVVLCILCLATLSFAQELVWEDIGRGNLNLKTVLIDQDNSKIIYIGTDNSGVFKSVDTGENWRNILSVRGENRAVNYLLFDFRDRNSLYAATGNGLFFSSDQGKNWKRIFKGKNYFENECATLVVLPSAIYLGTKGGLFVSKDKGRSWSKEAGKLGNSEILAIAYNPKEPNSIYVACVDGVFKTKDGAQSWERIFLAHPVENGDDKDEANEDRDEEERNSNIRYISIDSNNLNYLYLATSRGVYKSQDRGKTWELLSDYGLLDREVKFLLISPKSVLYAITKAGVFRYEQERWHELSLGLVAQDISSLYLDRQGRLYAACDKGLFRSKEFYSNNSKDNTISLYFKDEPEINKVQEAAIHYAEVEPGKIIRWRKQAARRAWLPQVSMGLDRNTTDLWHWEGGSTTKADDDILRKGHDSVEWDVRLTWDLSQLIYSDDQTNIDVRSKLMVQLRDDILDEVTKLYFERIRVKMEINNLTIEDSKKRCEKELKLQELTASLDALTGSYFSSHLPD